MSRIEETIDRVMTAITNGRSEAEDLCAIAHRLQTTEQAIMNKVYITLVQDAPDGNALLAHAIALGALLERAGAFAEVPRTLASGVKIQVKPEWLSFLNTQAVARTPPAGGIIAPGPVRPPLKSR